MDIVERYNGNKDRYFDHIIMFIKSGYIKCGKYSHLVKVDPDKKVKGKVFFDEGSNGSKDQPG